MNSDKIAVVFDTNSYRNLIRDTAIEDIEASIAQIKEKEASKNIVPIAAPVVGLELLANLSGPGKSLHYDECLKALIAMANHCCVEAEKSIHFIPHPYIHITKNFFDVVPPEVELKTKNMSGVIADFKEDYLKAIEGHQLNGTFTKIKDYVDGEESRWISEIERCVQVVRQEVLKLHPSIIPKHLRIKVLEYIDNGRFVPRISMAIIYSIAQSLQIKMTEFEHVHKGYILPRTFPISVGFYQWICRRVVDENIDLRNQKSRQTRWNWRWDYEVSFLINDHLLNGRLVLLVTSDKDMTKMLERFGYSARVMNLDKYLGLLEN